ncbi:hypothetical protein B0H15DRAFT_929547 [Mycena belliarum]|uniref:Uncharacterized protein n=1 Tax=Mycena belliarum TaxID=1033014 RepID=A0AAD6U7U0_9AGAR|nr:hypothetical protein B0H15DRAFT_929547 [Mycena belliae]
MIQSVHKACKRLESKLYELSESEDPLAIEVPKILTEACTLVRDANPADPEFSAVVDRVCKTANIGISLAYRDLETEYLPSFAHTRRFPLLQGPTSIYNLFPPSALEVLVQCMNFFLEQWRDIPLFAFVMWIFRSLFAFFLPKPWRDTPRPHPSSSPLSRFGPRPPSLPATSSPLVRSIYEARCEISSDIIYAEPIKLVSDGSCLALPSMGGHRQRTPILSYCLIKTSRRDEDPPLITRYTDVGLSEVAYACATDEQKKLIFVADRARVKSYAWADPRTGKIHKNARPTHTLASPAHAGPLAVLTPGTLLRAGKGSAAVWTYEVLPTHGRSGRTRIGPLFSGDSWRDDYGEVEDSAGSPATSVIAFADPKLAPAVWHPHPARPATMLCSTDPEESEDYSFIALDLAHGAQQGARYFGNGAAIGGFATSAAAPNEFMTAANDGHMRLHDTRVPLPVLSICAASGLEECGAVLFVHPDGIPAVFTGSTNDQVVRLWDIRARKMVYELATGNTAVSGMAWDAQRSALYVATSSPYDRYDYRRARLPPSMLPEPEPARGMPNVDDEGGFDKCWPKNAKHTEDYWGAVFDAGSHRILRYTFKEDADPSILPPYGEMTSG